MPKPVFITCSEASSVDRTTNSLSIFNVIDAISFSDAPQEELDQHPQLAVSRLVKLVVTAVWRRSDEEAESAFEYRTVITIPGQSTRRLVTSGSFVFKLPMSRFIHTFGGPQFQQEGIFVIENEIRPIDDEEWIGQRYEIPVDRLVIPAKKN